MAAEFDATLGLPKDRARLALGDVAAPFLLQDETYEAILAGDSLTASYVGLARSLASVCANRAVLVQQGTTKRQWNDRAAYYTGLAARWATEGVPDDEEFVRTGGLPLVGPLIGPNVDVLNRATGLDLSLTPPGVLIREIL